MSTETFLTSSVAQLGRPYIWGGKGELVMGAKHPFGGLVFDCSGLVTWCLRQAGYTLRGEYNADRMWHEWQHTDEPQPGDLVLYGENNHATHVEIVMPDGRFLGAIGGGSKTVKPSPVAKVQYRKLPRRDVLGYVVNPIRAATATKPVS